jgi:integrase
MRLDRLPVADVQAWLNHLATQCQCCAQGIDARRALRGTARCCAVGQCCHRVASPRTVKDIRTVRRSGLNCAARQELLDRHVAQLVQIPKQRERKLVPWTSEEARRFLESARADTDPLFAAYVLVLVLELRKGEVLGLAWEAVNFGQGTLVPDHQLQRVRRSLLYRETKIEASDASLPMPEIVVAALKIRRTQQDRERKAAAEIWQQTKGVPSLIFTGRYGTPIDPRTLNSKFTARCEAAGVRPITVHDARHTCPTLLVDLTRLRLGPPRSVVESVV